MGFFSTEKLKGSLGPDAFQQLQGAAVDKGAAFMSGQVTSSMNKVMSDKTSVSAIQVATKGAGIYSTADSLIKNPDILGELATNITASAVNVAATEMGKIGGKIAASAVQLPLSIPGRIQKYTQEAFNAYKLSFGEVLARVMKDQEEQAKENIEKEQKAKEENSKKSLAEKLNNAKDKLDQGLEFMNSYLGKVCDYIEEGPDYVAKEINKIITKGVNAANKAVDEKIQDAENAVDEQCKKQGYNIGKGMADEYNKALEKQAQKQLASQKNAISKASAMAFKAKQAAILQVMALTGVNVPI